MTWYPLLFALGACLGSFVNLVSLRLPALLDGQFINGDRADVPGLLRPGSRCTACLTPLRFYQNIPIASFIFLSGRCGFCTTRISPRYPVIEVIAALSAVMLGVVYEPDWQLAAVMLFACALLTLSLIDMDHQVLPDLLVLPLLWTGLLFNSLSLFVDLHSAVFGAVAGYLALWLSCQAHHILTGRAGMGHGDYQIVRRDWRLARCTDAAGRARTGMYLLFVIFGVPQVFSWSGYAGPCMFWPLPVTGCACNDVDVAVVVSFARALHDDTLNFFWRVRRRCTSWTTNLQKPSWRNRSRLMSLQKNWPESYWSRFGSKKILCVVVSYSGSKE